MRRLTQETIETLKGYGFDVYLSADPEWQTYCFFTDGENLGYVQVGYFGGFSFSTCHVPNRQTGTGFGLTERCGADMTESNAREAFCFAPNWAKQSDMQSVKKYTPGQIAGLMESKGLVKQ